MHVGYMEEIARFAKTIRFACYLFLQRSPATEASSILSIRDRVQSDFDKDITTVCTDLTLSLVCGL